MNSGRTPIRLTVLVLTASLIGNATPAVLGRLGAISSGAGLAEFRLPVAIVVLGEKSSIQVTEAQALTVLSGSVAVATLKGTATILCENRVELTEGGIYRFDLHEDSCRLRVYRGVAQVHLVTMTVALKTGTAMDLNKRCGDMIPWNDFDLSETDELNLRVRTLSE